MGTNRSYWLLPSNLSPPSPLIVSLLDVLCLLCLIIVCWHSCSCFFVLSSWKGTPCSWVCQKQALTLLQPIRLVFMCVLLCSFVCVRERETEWVRRTMKLFLCHFLISNCIELFSKWNKLRVKVSEHFSNRIGCSVSCRNTLQMCNH